MTDPILACLLAADDDLTDEIVTGAEQYLAILEAAVRRQSLRRHLAAVHTATQTGDRNG